ncbi:MAG: preprotein translocase subunit SecG [Candidatus Acididesulfobacter diazotrophicus]|jgi:preprotein translocase subunit SecG|uniref:Protein-export membrane protein SecG n=1 Tax=Candidatus Acididesulfobacter diazotrophicus TaxID=2597226 RepID=A0A519BLZ7_9DELT|nr:MAG: preprotein translocase subunit SecG [Candidatus Acididesulfobacter diazotrophicus]
MIAFLTVVLIVSAIFLVIVILMQQGKGQEMGAVFGGSSQTVFGASGAGNFLTKTTAILAAIFLGSAFLISYISAKQVSPISIKHYLKKPVKTASAVTSIVNKNASKKANAINPVKKPATINKTANASVKSNVISASSKTNKPVKK